MFDMMEFFKFEPGQNIVMQGELGNYFFVTHEGSLDVTIEGKNVNTIGAGQAFGAIALLYDCPRTATVSAKEASGVWGVHGDQFRKVMQAHAQKMYADNRQFLDCINFFDGFSVSTKTRIGELALVNESFPAGAYVLTRGEVPSAMYVVKKGLLTIITEDAEAPAESGDAGKGAGKKPPPEAEDSEEESEEEPRERNLHLGPGDSFGGGCMLDGDPSLYTVVTDEDCELLCLGFSQLKTVFGDDFVGCLQRTFTHYVLRQLTFISHLSYSQRNHIAQAMDVKRYAPHQHVEEGFWLIAVMDGEVSGTADGEAVSLKRGNVRKSEDLVELEMKFRPPDAVDNVGPDSNFPTGLVAGPGGARLVVLSKESMEHALKQLGLSAIDGAEEAQGALDYMRMMLMARKVPIFRELSEEQIEALINSLVCERYTAGALVFKQGEVGSAFYVVAQGEVRVVKDEDTVRILPKGACFGERSLLFDERRSATVEVSTPEAELWSIDRRTFKDIVTENMRKELVHRIRLQETNIDMKQLKHVRLIGSGAFGSVRLVEHKTTGMRYALKRVRKDGSKIPPEVTRECQILAEIDHPFMIQMLKTYETSGSIYMLTELITGGQLYEQLKQMGVLTRKQAQFYVGSVALVLESLHDRGIMYRDLKPENVMLDMQGYLKLVDFGLAKRLDANSERSFTLVGTVFYMAPEVIKRRGYGTEVDIWSLGVMMYEFVCGKLPFGDDLDDDHEICAEILEAPLKFPTRYNDQAGKKLIEGMLRKEPDSRLGMGMGGWDDVKNHKFFKIGMTGSLFNKIVGRELTPPHVPGDEHYSDETELNTKVTLSDAEELATPDAHADALQGKVSHIFRKFDINNDGRIECWELTEVLRSLDEETFSDDVIDGLMASMGGKQNGTVDYEEFLGWIFSPKATAEATLLRDRLDKDLHD